MRATGRLMQHVALIAPPLAIVMQLLGRLTVWQMLIMLVAALSLFWLGRLIEGYSAR